MSILIKGMKMPKSCVDCPMFDWDLEYLRCKANDKYFKANGEWRKGIESTCPLIEVSEDVQSVKHGEWKHVQWVKDDEAQAGGYWISRCSNCIMPYHSETPYCPHCGAKMDGDKNG